MADTPYRNRRDPFEQMMGGFFGEHNEHVKPELLKRKDDESRKRRRRHKRNPVPPYQPSPLARLLLHRARMSTYTRFSLKGVPDLPDDEDINGAVLCVEVEETGEILLTQDKQKQLREGVNRFTLPGGGKEDGENIARTVLREGREEVGIWFGNVAFKLVGVVPLHDNPAKKRAVFYCKVSQSSLHQARPGKEQIKLHFAKPGHIDLFAVTGALPPNHVNFWSLIRNSGLIVPR